MLQIYDSTAYLVFDEMKSDVLYFISTSSVDKGVFDAGLVRKHQLLWA